MGLDSVELVMAFEESFGCQISDDAAEKMRTPRDVIDWLIAEQDARNLFREPNPNLSASSGWLGRLFPSQKHEDRRLENRIYSRDEIRDHVFRTIIDQLGVDKVWEDADFVRDLGMD